MKSRKWWILTISLLAFVSCKKEEEETPIPSGADYSQGVYVVNEGTFLQNNASITYISLNGEVVGDVFQQANGIPVGDVLQDFVVYNGKGYAVVNSSQRLVVVNAKDFYQVASIEGLDYPRYFLPVNASLGMVTNGSMSGQVYFVNLANNTLSGSVAVGNGPETMTISGNHVFVCNSGGWISDNTVSVINASTLTVDATVTVGDRPIDAVTLLNGDVLVLCSGETLYDENFNVIGHSNASLYQIDGDDFTSTEIGTIGITGDHPRTMALSASGDLLYINNNGIYTWPVGGSWVLTAFMDGSFNSIDTHPITGEIWVTGPASFVGNSEVFHYNTSGTLLESIDAGIGTNGVRFH